jgi:Family of unknown function (DUF5360)
MTRLGQSEVPQSLKTLLFVTDGGFVLYWGVTALLALNLFSIPPEWLFKDYHDLTIIAWNWSFMPLDLLASLSGLIAVRRASIQQHWQTMALISMSLTFCAGFMAISFWTVQRSFDAAWWAPNLFLTFWPLIMASKVRAQP